jgi:hypothetical protein
MYGSRYMLFAGIPSMLFLSILSYNPVITPEVNAQFYAEVSNTDGTNATSSNTQDSNSSANIVLMSQKFKKAKFGITHVVGQVKNTGNDTARYVRIDLTTFDKNGDVLGTDYTYVTADTLKPNQKSSFDLSSTQDNFKGMKYYELSLQWQDSDGTDQYVENAHIVKDQDIVPTQSQETQK